MDWWFVYLFTRATTANTVLLLLTLVSFIIFAVSLIMYAIYKIGSVCGYESDREKNGETANIVRKWAVVYTIQTLILSLLWVATPTTKEAAAIYLIPKIVNNEEVQKVPTNALKVLNSKFEEWLKDMVPQEETTNE